MNRAVCEFQGDQTGQRRHVEALQGATDPRVVGEDERDERGSDNGRQFALEIVVGKIHSCEFRRGESRRRKRADDAGVFEVQLLEIARQGGGQGSAKTIETEVQRMERGGQFRDLSFELIVAQIQHC
jgi:hypothetical protein